MTKVNGKILAIVALVVFLLAGAAGAGYAYWAGSITAPADETGNVTISVGTGQAVSTEITLSGSGTGTLVPAGRAASGQVEYVIYTFSVNWKEVVGEGNALAGGNAGTLFAAVDTDSKKIDGSAANAGLVVTAVQIGGTAPVDGVLSASNDAISLDGNAVNVYVKVTLTEPDTKTVYDAVAGKDITFSVDFSVTPAN